MSGKAHQAARCSDTRQKRSVVLQCTAVTPLPAGEALVALLGMRGGPDDAVDLLAEMGFVLCESGEHTEETEHAARLWTAETQPPRGLWFLWTGSGGGLRVHHRFTTLTLCPARLHGGPRACGGGPTTSDTENPTTEWSPRVQGCSP